MTRTLGLTCAPDQFQEGFPVLAKSQTLRISRATCSLSTLHFPSSTSAMWRRTALGSVASDSFLHAVILCAWCLQMFSIKEMKGVSVSFGQMKRVCFRNLKQHPWAHSTIKCKFQYLNPSMLDPKAPDLELKVYGQEINCNCSFSWKKKQNQIRTLHFLYRSRESAFS